MNYELFGLQFDPFTHLDSTKDENLHEYLVIPKAVESLWDDAPVAILAEPGSGKSALRRYAEKAYRDTRGAKLPVTYVPATYNLRPSFHPDGLKQALARAVFIYLISYPEIFLHFSATQREKCVLLLAYLPYDLDFLLEVSQATRLIAELEQLLGIGAISRITQIGPIHQEMFAHIGTLAQKQLVESREKTIPDLFFFTRDLFEVHSFQILVDELDGFVETTSTPILLQWIEPLIRLAAEGSRNEIYFKFFLPFQITELSSPDVKTVSLEWDNGLLADVIRRRLYIASRGGIDTLDAISAPGVRNADLRLAQQLREDQKRPREIIKSARALLGRASANRDACIHEEDFFSEETNHVEPFRA